MTNLRCGSYQFPNKKGFKCNLPIGHYGWHEFVFADQITFWRVRRSQLEENILDRFWVKVDKTGSCWNWMSTLDQDGYGKFWLRGKRPRAYRVSWWLKHGIDSIPAGLMVDHICRNRKCVNPDHLRLVTPRQNSLENNIGPTALNAQKTHCENGHPYDTKWGNGPRLCRMCCNKKRRDRRSLKAIAYLGTPK